jgi:GntR family transcriptional regulator, histidine utilization repressor
VALRELQSEGLVQRVQGVGTFAAQLHPVSSTLTIRDLHEEIEARGHRHHVDVQYVREERAGPALAAQLGLADGARVFHSMMVHFDNGVALQCEDRFVNPDRAPDYLKVDFTRTTPTIEAGPATALEARLLGLAPGEPCLIVVRRTMSRGSTVTLVRLAHPGSRYRIEGRFTP